MSFSTTMFIDPVVLFIDPFKLVFDNFSLHCGWYVGINSNSVEFQVSKLVDYPVRHDSNLAIQKHVKLDFKLISQKRKVIPFGNCPRISVPLCGTVFLKPLPIQFIILKCNLIELCMKINSNLTSKDKNQKF